MTVGNVTRVQTLMQEGVRKGVFPGAVLYVGIGERVVLHQAYGLADITSDQPMTVNTVFDLASLTKPLATAPAVIKLFDAGWLSPQDALGSVLPLFAGIDRKNINIANLLCHTAGFPSHKPFYHDLSCLPPGPERRETLLRMVAAEPLVCLPGQNVIYSDLGYITLRGVVEAVTRERLDRFAARILYQPLGLSDLFFVDRYNRRSRDDREFAATEFCSRRRILLKGEVHDDNAYEAGGVDGQAGLFGTAQSVAGLLAELLSVYHGGERQYLLNRQWAAGMLEQQGQTGRTWGFDMPAAGGSAAGRFFSPTSIGHLGFTGTSVWVDVPRKIIVVLLTNRVHPDRHNEAIRAFRPRLHDAVMSAVLSEQKNKEGCRHGK